MESPASESPSLELASPEPSTTPAPRLLWQTSQTQTPYLQIAHVLFMDIVGYSRLRMASQGGVQLELQKIVQETEEVRQAQARSGGLIIRPSGDGMALLFFHDLLSPVRCAIEISNILAVRGEEIKAQTGGQITLRMGVHTGPVLMVEDLNQQADVAGDGIVYAQRVMDCGDGGHILLSDSMAKAIEKMDPWARWLTDLGTVRVKHNVQVHLYNLCGRTIGGPANFGNVGVPVKVSVDAAARRSEAREREARKNVFEAEEGLRPYIRSLVMMLCALGFIGCVIAAFALRSPQTLRDIIRVFMASVTVSTNRTTNNPKLPKSRQTHDPNQRDSSVQREGSGSEFLFLPRFEGKTFTAAKARADRLGLKIIKSDRSEYMDDVPAGRIFLQSPLPNTPYQRGAAVYVRVSKGPMPVGRGDDTPPVPDDDTLPAQQAVPSRPEPTPTPPPAPLPYTGVLIDASHLPGMKRSQYAKVLGPDGQIYPEGEVDSEGTPIGFYTSISAAEKGICGAHPLVLKAEAVEAPNGIDCSVRLNASQINRWNETAANLNLAQSRKVGILLP